MKRPLLATLISLVSPLAFGGDGETSISPGGEFSSGWVTGLGETPHDETLRRETCTIAGNYEDWVYDKKLSIRADGSIRSNMSLQSNGYVSPVEFGRLEPRRQPHTYRSRGEFKIRYSTVRGLVECGYLVTLELSAEANGILYGTMTYPTYPGISMDGHCSASLENSVSEFEFTKAEQ
jgi:hypothetical protein